MNKIHLTALTIDQQNDFSKERIKSALSYHRSNTQSKSEVFGNYMPDFSGVCHMRVSPNPIGFYNHNSLMEGFRWSAENTFKKDLDNGQVVTAALAFASEKLPSFFIGEELIEALLKTDVPDDVCFSDIEQAYPGFNLVFPVSSKIEQIIFVDLSANKKLQHLSETHDAGYNLILSKIGASYCAVAASRKMSFRNIVEEESRRIGETDPEHKRVIPLLFNLVCYLSTLTPESGIVEHSQLIRKAHPARGQDALWSPAFIGRTYRIKREGEPVGGSHASPRLHWRRGHWRHQRHGQGRSLVKLIFIDPLLINSNQNNEN